MQKTPVFVPGPPVGRRRRRRDRASSVTPPALTLVASEFAADPFVDLVFDRAIDLAGIVPSSIRVSDPNYGVTFEGVDANLLTAQSVRVSLADLGPSEGPTLTLTVAAGNGIVAVDDGGTWAGVTGLELPFP